MLVVVVGISKAPVPSSCCCGGDAGAGGGTERAGGGIIAGWRWERGVQREAH